VLEGGYLPLLAQYALSNGFQSSDVLIYLESKTLNSLKSLTSASLNVVTPILIESVEGSTFSSEGSLVEGFSLQDHIKRIIKRRRK